ncbi:MAG: 5-(carboxyamino)imidazole ribonucleotide mutase [Candidatus Methanomethylophilaceae archaeon]|nr:5-(carboxyamino)imidazole ribonucleotide mutase [Candidatus Methanomethylophilaceae archaeon]
MSKVSIIMGSKSDMPVADKAIAILRKFGVQFDIAVASAHRTPRRVEDLVTGSDADVFISIAGLSAALPGVVASYTVKPVIGVPVSGSINIDALFSIVQMPPGIPVAAVGMDRGENAAVLALEIIALNDADLRDKLIQYRREQAEKVVADSEKVISDVGC